MSGTSEASGAPGGEGEATVDRERDLTIERVIRAPRARVWEAWADPRQLEQWWIPSPTRCVVDALELWPGGAFVTRMSDDGGELQPHIDGCILAVEPGERLVFSTALAGGWRPAPNPFITAVISFDEHPQGTLYRSLVLHKDADDRATHERLGFADGWGTVIAQLAAFVER